MELEEAIAARERFTQVLSQSPAATNARVRQRTDRLIAPLEDGGSGGNGPSRSPARKGSTT